MTTYVQNDSVVAARVEDVITLLEPASGVYFGLDTVGARTWGLLEREQTLSELVSSLCSEYDVTPEQCSQETHALLMQLVDAGLVRAAEHP